MQQNKFKKGRKPIIKVKHCLTIFVGWVILTYWGIFSWFLQVDNDNVVVPLSTTKFNNNIRYDHGDGINNVMHYRKPPLENYIQGWNITGDVSWLLDFAIVGVSICVVKLPRLIQFVIVKVHTLFLQYAFLILLVLFLLPFFIVVS